MLNLGKAKSYGDDFVEGSGDIYVKNVKLDNISKSTSFSGSNRLSVQSVLFMIEHEKSTSPITLTYKKDLYDKVMAEPGITELLQKHPNVSLASV